MAFSRDESISHTDGSPKQITSPEQNAWSHRMLRAKHDAILVGVGTILSDNPQLNTRFDQNSYNPLRIVLDPNYRSPVSAQVLDGSTNQKTLFLIKKSEQEKDLQKGLNTYLEQKIFVEELPMEGDSFQWNALWSVLTTPNGSFPGVSSILVEGGRTTWQHFQRAGFVDMEVILRGE